ncbi:MAG: BamA/TamA family outer membrane protein [Bacteroidota bacterium]
MTQNSYSKVALIGRWITMLSVIFMFSCSQIKFVAEDDYLLNKVELQVDNQDINKDEAKSYIRQKENYKILGFIKFHLMLYNLSSKKRTDDWLKRIGEAPQIYDEIMTDRSVEQLKQYMNNKGFYRAQVSNEVELNDETQKARLKFYVNAGEQYTIRRINYHFNNSDLKKLFFNDSINLSFSPGAPFDYYELENQQGKIVDLYKNNGYFYFTKDHVHYLADTVKYDKEVILDLIIGDTRNSQVDSAKVFKPYYLNDFYYSVMPGNTPVTAERENFNSFSDTLQWESSYLYQNKKIKYPPSLFDRTTQMKSGELYKSSTVENTFFAFNRLRQFRFVDIQFNETNTLQDNNLLDCNIRLAPLNKQSTSFDIEGTNTSGNFGVAGNIYYQHRNFFRGAEVFQLRLKGAMERMAVKDISDYFNTREFGVETNLIIPKLLGPGKYIRSFGKYLPKTVINAGYNYQRRPEYTRTISNFKIGYDWKTTQDLSHMWNFLDLNVVKLYEFDQEFLDGIKDLYIKSSFTDHFIFAMNYSLIYNNQRLNTKKSYTYLRFNVESAGNLLWAISNLTGQPKYQAVDSVTSDVSEYYQFLNTRYAQYVKSDIEVRRSVRIDKYNSVVGRAFIGVGLPYGNFDVLPFEKKYFAGGANGIRAWQVRSLGPGTYKAPPGAYPNQSSDIKLEANVEYRFKLVGPMEGALFLDAGNIWAINEKDNREGAQFKFNEFYKQIALGTGAGLRFDLNYFILRTDLGIKLRDPAKKASSGWLLGARTMDNDIFNFTFAIGYPF